MPAYIIDLGEALKRIDRQEALIARAKRAGIDVDAHRCQCETCARTSLLCPASESSLRLAVTAAEGPR